MSIALPLWARRALAWLAVVAWMGLIFYLSSQPVLPEHPSGAVDYVSKKAAHLMVYAVLAALWWRALAREGLSPGWAFALALAASVLYGLSDELHQTFVPGREGRLTDVGYDLLGAALALAILGRWRGLRRLLGARSPRPRRALPAGRGA